MEYKKARIAGFLFGWMAPRDQARDSCQA